MLKNGHPTIIDLDFAKIEIYDNYIVTTVNEGILFNLEHLEKYHIIFEAYFPDKYFGFISNRINDYTVNPICYYSKYDNFPWLLGEAVLCYSHNTYQTVSFEKNFCKRHFEIFYILEECKEWFNKLRENKKAGL